MSESQTDYHDPTIYNCHIHTFTMHHVPEQFLKTYYPRLGFLAGGFGAILLRRKRLANSLLWLLKRMAHVFGLEGIERLVRFLDTGRADSQEEIFEKIKEQYPEKTVFVVLPMDMTQMNAGRIKIPPAVQHRKLLQMAKQSAGQLIPFYAVDPQREDFDRVLADIEEWVENRPEEDRENKFRGIKLYPSLGYDPRDERLRPVYKLCQERKVPIMTHCSPGGIRKYRLSREEARRLCHPQNYIPILEEFDRLKICLAHFGGNEEWDYHLRDPSNDPEHSWVRIIAQMIRTGKYPHLYTDISYTLFTPDKSQLYFDYYDYLKVLLAHPHLRKHVLFGSDYYMIEREELTEKEVSITLRSRLGEELYFQIANKNPKRYLGIS